MIFIAIPTHDYVPARFAQDLAELYAHSSAAMWGNIELHMMIGTYVHSARQQLAQEALDAGATAVLWIDSDMTFPRDALLRLIERNVPFIGINYATRSLPAHFVAKKNGSLVRTTPSASGIEKVDAIGFGLVLMWADVLVQTLKHGGAPLFRHEWNEERQASIGEDFSFCRRARAAGFDVMVDHDLSLECGHVGTFQYRPEHATGSNA